MQLTCLWQETEEVCLARSGSQTSDSLSRHPCLNDSTNLPMSETENQPFLFATVQFNKSCAYSRSVSWDCFILLPVVIHTTVLFRRVFPGSYDPAIQHGYTSEKFSCSIVLGIVIFPMRINVMEGSMQCLIDSTHRI